MRKLSLTFPDQIIEELSLLCKHKPKVCKKESKLGWTSNDRIIIVRDNFIQYYNLHPGFYQEDEVSLKRKYFKAAVRLDFIHQVNFLPKNKIKKTYIQLIFPEKKVILRASDQANQTMNEEDDYIAQKEQKLEKWLFEFPFDVKEFIESKKEEQKEKERTLAKIAPLSPKEVKQSLKEPIKLEPSALAVSPTPKSVQLDESLEHNIEQYVQSIQKTKNLLKTKAELAEEQKVRQRKKKEKELAEIMSSKNQSVQESFGISSFWREYYKFYEAVIKCDFKAQRNQKIEKELCLLREIEYFNGIAKKIARNYVDQLVCGFDQTTKQFQGFYYYQGLWLKTGGKQLNQQFMVNYNINDILFTLKEIKGYKFRLPLMSLIEYKGVKLLVMCDMPFSELEKTQVYNLHSHEGDLQLMGKLKDCLDVIEDVLNVKSEPYDIDAKKKVLAPLGPKLKVFQYNFKKDKTQDQLILPNFYYLINPAIIFPIDYNCQKEGHNTLARLRPQLVAFFRDYCKDQNCQLLTQAFMRSSLPPQAKRIEDAKVKSASKLIESYWIPLLIDKINSLQLLFVDSYSIKCIMQEMGINIRYLYRIHEKIGLPYVREMIAIQALARTIKKEFQQALNDISMESAAEEQRSKLREGKDEMIYINERKIEGLERFKLFALDYLNLVFGVGQESAEFWKVVLFKCQKYFKIKSEFPPIVKHGCLLNAVLWHCGLSMTFEDTVPLFKSQTPFKGDSNLEFQLRLKTFDFPSFQLQKLFRSAPSIQDNISADLYKQANPKLLKMQLLFGSTIGTDWQYNATLSKLSNFQEFLEVPNLKNKLHPILIPYYLTNKSKYNFQCALRILNFSMPQTHPLFVSLYLEYADIFDRELMKKTTMLIAVKAFGEFHQKTTEIYSRFYHQGDDEYYLKAQRLKSIASRAVVCEEFFEQKKYESCLEYCLSQITLVNDKNASEKLGTGNYMAYLMILMQGLESSMKIVQLDKGIAISKQISAIISSFKYKDQTFTEKLFRSTLIIHLLKSNKKYFLYKMVLFIIHIRKQHEELVYNSIDMVVPCGGLEKEKILEGLSIQYYAHGNHSSWIGFIFSTIVKSFQYFNFLEDLFNNYAEHLKRYNSDEFKTCLGYMDLLIRVYGQELFKENLYDVRLN